MFVINPARDRRVNNEYAKIQNEIYMYIADNFFTQLGISHIDASNFHHIFDGFIAHRDAFFALGFYELVDEMNFCLDNLVDFLPDIAGNDKYNYRTFAYRPYSIKKLYCLDSTKIKHIPRGSNI